MALLSGIVSLKMAPATMAMRLSKGVKDVGSSSLLVRVAGFARIATGGYEVGSPVCARLHDHGADVADPGAPA
jgi:hypothetical protein